ncbi:hypothetical protein CR513_22202, partial [Mucuna pruriens]
MIPIEIGEPLPRRSSFDPSENLSSLRLANNEQPANTTLRSNPETSTKTISCGRGLETQGRRRKTGSWHPIGRDHSGSENPSTTTHTT